MNLNSKSLLLLIFFVLISCSKDDALNLPINNGIEIKEITISGSSRANAYELYNRFIFSQDTIYFSFLDFENNNQIVKITPVSFSQQDKIDAPTTIGTSIDNHGAATLVLDSKSRIHAFYGAHNSPLKYRHSEKESNYRIWSKEKILGNGITYPSAVVNSKNEIFIIYRYGFNINQKDPWEYKLMKINNGKIVFDKTILISRKHDKDFVDRYIHYFAQLTIDSNENLHLAFILHERSSKDPVIPKNGVGYGIGYLTSNNEGFNWQDHNGKEYALGAMVSELDLLKGQKDISGLVNDFRSVSISINPSTNLPSIGYTFYNISERTWNTHIIKRELSGWKDRYISDDLYKISYAHYLNEEFIIGEKLENINSSVEEGWSNNNTKIVLRKILNDGTSNEIFASKNENKPNWYPSFPKNYSYKEKPRIASFMIGNEDGHSKVYTIKF